jgi:hypothetical protein
MSELDDFMEFLRKVDEQVCVGYIIEQINQLRSDNLRLAKERDLAIVHDAQPYPTAEAYERVCEVLNKTKTDNLRLQKAVDDARKIFLNLGIGHRETLNVYVGMAIRWLANNKEK